MPENVIRDACEEGILSLYALIPPGIQVVNEQFETDLPCLKVEPFQASGGALAERVTQEMQAGKNNADVIQNFSPAFLDSAAAEGWLEEYVAPTASNVPAEWTNPGKWYSIGLTPSGVFWNTEMVTPEQQTQLEAIETWDDVFNVEGLDGKVGLVDIRAGGTSQAPLYVLHKNLGVEWWQKAAEQFHPTIFDSITPMTELLAAGGLTASLVSETTVPGALKQEGAPLAWVYPTPVAGVPQMLAIAKDPPHPAAAQVYMTWSLSQHGLATWSAANYLAPVSDETPDDRSFASESWFKNPKADDYDAIDWGELGENLPKLTEEFDQVFK